MRKNKGFTLIELLVVIAIIGILSSIVLASLSTARGKAANSAIKSQLASARASAELYYNDNQTYGSSGTTGVCAAGGDTLRLLCESGVDAGVACTYRPGAGAGTGPLYCYASQANGIYTYVMGAPLRVAEGSHTSWCVDSSGNSRGVSGPISGWGLALTSCP